MFGYAEILKLKEDFCCHHRDRQCQKSSGLHCSCSFTALGRAQKQIVRAWHYSMQQCRTLSLESLVSSVNKGMGHILGHLLLLEIMEISSLCAKASPFSWQRPIVMMVKLASTFNFTIDVCGRSFMFTFLSCVDQKDWLLSKFLVSVFIFASALFSKYFSWMQIILVAM